VAYRRSGYPVDGWTVGNAFPDASPQQAHRYGVMVAERYAWFPNIVWMTGGDHFPSDLPGRHAGVLRVARVVGARAGRIGGGPRRRAE
jgi:hypothetical protein